ncbi:hypothetical protein LEAN103870_08405 [Legionella anisa]|uniref:Uncharacterized protein n=1 Tax=Legionella anisa TaxID=28082 RepID=A0AAX0WVA9_9GAMM|nr:hypothetical protein [Legionella anisa]AWN74028.1 hypothetical protein DLD14_09350 [Legionella anisa]KTC67301.1 hypothetical protein Lani_3646 [Legionella anisa]MBN5934029.1 hypothetical protein [Legionella anisa]MCW8425952.1 hypothetical protein [Legionella anisa]MCW8448614.1 hypothetical protein [Legionella anisa]
MLNLIGWTEISEILDLNDEAQDENYLSGVIERTVSTYRERPGFFTRYQDGQEFAGGLLAPLWYPTASAIGTAFMAFTVLMAACYFVGFTLLGLLSIIMMNAEYRNTALEGVANSLALTGLTLLGTVAGVLLTALSFPHSIISLFTRSAATAVSSTTDCCENDYQNSI